MTAPKEQAQVTERDQLVINMLLAAGWDLRAEFARIRAERDDEVECLREALAPFALFNTAINGVPLHKDVITYGRQGLRANAFAEAALVFANTERRGK